VAQARVVDLSWRGGGRGLLYTMLFHLQACAAILLESVCRVLGCLEFPLFYYCVLHGTMVNLKWPYIMFNTYYVLYFVKYVLSWVHGPVGAKRNGQQTGAPPPAHTCIALVCDAEAHVPVCLCCIYACVSVLCSMLVWSLASIVCGVGCAADYRLYWTSGEPISCLLS
jgi:hypothetical protein